MGTEIQLCPQCQVTFWHYFLKVHSHAFTDWLVSGSRWLLAVAG